MLYTVLLIIIVLVLVGAITPGIYPRSGISWGYGYGYGHWSTGVLALIVVALIFAVLRGV